MIDNTAVIIAICAVISVSLTLIGFVFGNNTANEKKRARIYQRIGEGEQQAAKKYVNKDVCDVTHKFVASTLKEIKDDVKTILDMNGGRKKEG